MTDTAAALSVDVEALSDVAWALGRPLYEPIELSAPVLAGDASAEERRETFDHNRLVEMRLIAQLITAGPQDSPPLTVRRLFKLARAAGFKHDSGCTRHPENIILCNGPPITALLRAYVTAERTIAVLAPESYRNGRRPGGSRPGTELLARLLAWPTKDAAAQLIGDPDETIAAGSDLSPLAAMRSPDSCLWQRAHLR